MDIAIDSKVLRRRHYIAWGRWLLIAVAAVVLLLLRELITPAVARSNIRTAVVERGAISTQVMASGFVVPKIERVLISPVSSSIEEVFVRLGSKVAQGDPILKLDSARIALNISRLRDELLLKDLEIEGLLQQQQKQLRELHNQQALTGIDAQNLKITLKRYETLYQSNIVSELDFETAGLNVQKTELQLEQLAQQIKDTLASDSNQIEQRKVEKQLLLQQLMEQEKLQSDTSVRASSDGIITDRDGSLTISLKAGTGNLELEIQDSAGSLTQVERHKMFKPFHSTKRNGQGIGLMLVREMLQQHGFSYSLECAAGDWTRFTILMKNPV